MGEIWISRKIIDKIFLKDKRNMRILMQQNQWFFTLKFL